MPLTVACDLDGTLLWAEGMGEEPDSPRYDVIMLLGWLEGMFGCEISIWSGGGIEYASRWKQKLGLKYPVVEKGSFIPDIAIDDEEVTLGKVNLKV